MLSSAAHPLIGIDPEIRFGRPCIAGTRISVNDVLGWLNNGMGMAAIIQDFPELTPELIQACHNYAADRLEPYSEAVGREADFRITYRLLTKEEGGRKTPAYQHIRWDFRYEGRTETWMIWPEFLDPDGKMVPNGPFSPVGQANMFIVNPERRQVHRQYILPGVRGYFVEGPTRVGVCEVVKVLGLRKPLADTTSQ
ncbi:MAG: DUF433 domain-containing protein [Janthinobacterium lividum]